MGRDPDKTVELTNELTRQMKAIAADLWKQTGALAADGAMPVDTAKMKTAENDPRKPEKTEKTETNTKPAPKSQVPSFQQLWQTADETVDWTEVLTYRNAPDGLTSDTLWAFLRKHAEGVLNGDMKDYVEVLKTTNPLGDLTPFASGMQIRAVSPDRLEATFECMPAAMEAGEKKKAQYLCGMGIRVARDLLALLPVLEVGVQGTWNGEIVLDVTYPRKKFRKQNFSFVDPVSFTRECEKEI